MKNEINSSSQVCRGHWINPPSPSAQVSYPSRWSLVFILGFCDDLYFSIQATEKYSTAMYYICTPHPSVLVVISVMRVAFQLRSLQMALSSILLLLSFKTSLQNLDCNDQPPILLLSWLQCTDLVFRLRSDFSERFDWVLCSVQLNFACFWVTERAGWYLYQNFLTPRYLSDLFFYLSDLSNWPLAKQNC